MSVLNAILGGINRFFFWLGTPFRVFNARLQQARSLNPIYALRANNPLYALRGAFSQLRFNLAQISRLLRLPPFLRPFKLALRPLGLGKADDDAKPAADQSSYVTYKRRRRRARWRDIDLPLASQIHLVHQTTRERTVLHIGTKTGSSVAEVTLLNGGHPPVRIRFRQVNPEQYGVELVLTHIAGKADVFANGRAVIGVEVPVEHGMPLVVERQVYHCELYGEVGADLPPATRVQAGWFTHTGLKRQNNEDAIGIYQHADAYLFVMADGVGGGEAGELISEFAARYLLATFHRNVHYRFAWEDVLRRAFTRINDEVWHFTQRNALGKAGTTLTAIVIQQWDAYIVHVGDTRVYRLNNRTLEQITVDHVTREVEEVTRFEEGMPEQSHLVLSKAIGKAATVNADWHVVRIQPGDKLLMTTDGVTESITSEDLAEVLLAQQPADAATRLIEVANNRDGRDNASVIVIGVLSHAFDWDAWRAEAAERVFVGYTRVRPLKAQFRGEHLTRYAAPRLSPRRVMNVIFGIIIIALIILLLLFPPARSSAMGLTQSLPQQITLEP